MFRVIESSLHPPKVNDQPDKLKYFSIFERPNGIVPRPASASRALLRLNPCHRAYLRPT